MTKTALVVGGTGPTGPFIVNGLRARGYKVAILHRGNHEIDEIPADVEHIHTDPHFLEPLTEALAGRTFDLCIATYGRIRFVAEALAGKAGRFIAAGGYAYRSVGSPASCSPPGAALPIPEDADQCSEDENRFFAMIAATERRVWECHPDAAIFRYPYVYGPHQVAPREWSIIRRILDRRDFIILPEGGSTLMTHGYAENVAAAMLAAVDQPGPSAGKAYNCGDQDQYTLKQVTQIVAAHMGATLDILPARYDCAGPMRAFFAHGNPGHQLVDLYNLRSDLGYRDVVPAVEAIGRTVDWLLAHPLERGGHMESVLADAFDYPVEDRMADVIRASETALRDLNSEPFVWSHPYAHPKALGEADHRGR